jgi:hypothetical protein
MENGLCGAGAALFIYGLLSLYRLTRWSRARAPGADVSGDPPRSALRRTLGLHGEFGASGLLLAVTTAGFFSLLRSLFGTSRGAAAAALALGLALGFLATASCTHALVELARARSRCADLEAAALGAFRRIATLDDARRDSERRLAHALREKEEAEARAAVAPGTLDAELPTVTRGLEPDSSMSRGARS